MKSKRTRKLNLCSDEREIDEKSRQLVTNLPNVNLRFSPTGPTGNSGKANAYYHCQHSKITHINFSCNWDVSLRVSHAEHHSGHALNAKQQSNLSCSISTPKTTTTICRWHCFSVVVVVGLCVWGRQAKQFVWLFKLFSNWFLALHCELADFVPSVYLCHKHMTVAIDNETQFQFWLSPSPLPFSRHGWMNIVSCCSCRKLLFVQQETHPIILLLCGSCNVCGHVKAQRHRQGRRKWKKEVKTSNSGVT